MGNENSTDEDYVKIPLFSASQKVQAWFDVFYTSKNRNKFNKFYFELYNTNPPENMFDEEIEKRSISPPFKTDYWKNRHILWSE